MTQQSNEKKTPELDIHDVRQKMARALSGLQKEDILQENKKILRDFVEHRRSEGISISTLYSHYSCLLWVSRFITRPFDQLNEKDVRKIVGRINEHCRSEHHRVHKLVLLKKGLQIIKGYPKPKAPHIRYPPEIAWINTSLNRTKISRPSWDDLITEEEIYRQVIRHAHNSRDKLLLVMLRESGARIGSIANAKIGDVVFRDFGFILRARKDKTGPIDIPFYIATPYMIDWLEDHPCGGDADAPLFVRRRKGYAQLKYMGIYSALQAIFRRAGLNKRFNPHHFRHSDASIMGLYLPTSLMEQKYNWCAGSSMPSVYQHVSGKQVDVAMRRLRGLSADELPKPMTAPFCKKCKVIVKIHTLRCSRCRQQVKMKDMDEQTPDKPAPGNGTAPNATQELVSAFATALEKVMSGKTLRA